MSRHVAIAASEGSRRIMANIWMINRVVLIRWVIVIVAMVVIAPRAEATIIMPVAQERYVKAEAFAGDPDIQVIEDDASDFASDYGRFESSVTARLSWAWTPWASASHSSSILNTRIIASGLVQSGGGGGDIWIGANGVSSFSLIFELTTPQKFSITGSLSTDGYWSDASILFSGPSEIVLNESIPRFVWEPVHINFGISGVLDPGQYTLTASSSSGHPSTASFDFICEIPEPATILTLVFGIYGLRHLNRKRAS